eukprot:scaffold39436_cov40-Cyclotella_meneghiniana.AAC.1
MAVSLQIAASTTPNPTNTITNVYATGGGVGGIDSAATAVTITAKAIDKCKNKNDVMKTHFTSVGEDRGQRGPQKYTQTTQQSIGMRAGTQQPTGSTFEYNNKRMRMVGGGGEQQ